MQALAAALVSAMPNDETYYRTLVQFGFRSSLAYAILNNPAARTILFTAIRSGAPAVITFLQNLYFIVPLAFLPLALYGGYRVGKRVKDAVVDTTNRVQNMVSGAWNFFNYYDGEMVYSGQEEINMLDSMLTEGLAHYYYDGNMMNNPTSQKITCENDGGTWDGFKSKCDYDGNEYSGHGAYAKHVAAKKQALKEACEAKGGTIDWDRLPHCSADAK